VRIDGAHGQYISNVHLEPYTSVAQFHSDVYPKYHDGLIGAAASFLKKTAADPGQTLFLISAGAFAGFS
jgi:histone deacetylase HOS3